MRSWCCRYAYRPLCFTVLRYVAYFEKLNHHKVQGSYINGQQFHLHFEIQAAAMLIILPRVKCEITLYEPEEKKSFWKLSSRLKDIIKMFMKELNWDVYWFNFPQHRDRLKAFVFPIMNLRFPHSNWNFLINWGNVRLSRWTQLCGINALWSHRWWCWYLVLWQSGEL